MLFLLNANSPHLDLYRKNGSVIDHKPLPLEEVKELLRNEFHAILDDERYPRALTSAMPDIVVGRGRPFRHSSGGTPTFNVGDHVILAFLVESGVRFVGMIFRKIPVAEYDEYEFNAVSAPAM